MAKLIWQRGDGKSQVFDVPGGEAVIGRDPASTVRIDGASVSKRHATLRVTADGGSITDLGSSNGTKVNGKAITSSPLQDGDRLDIGTEKVTFRASAATSTQPVVADAPAGGSRKGLVFGGAALIVVALLMAVAGVMRGASGSRAGGASPPASSQTPMSAAAPAPVSAAAPAPIASPTPEPAPPPVVATQPVPAIALPDAAGRPLPSNDPGVLYDIAIAEIRGGRFVEARRLLVAATSRDPANPSSRERLRQVEAAIQSLTDRHLAAGQRAFTYLRFDDAIVEWEQVVGMTDPADPRRQQALTGIAQARARLAQR